MKTFRVVLAALAVVLVLGGCNSPTSGSSGGGSSSTVTYTITYNANGGTGTMATQMADASSAITLTANSFTRTGYTFSGWATSASGTVVYADQASINVGTSDVTLYAVWSNQTGGTTTVTQPSVNTVTISGSTTLSFGQTYTYTSTYTGTVKSYQWYLDGAAIPGATSSSVSLSPTVSTVTYGAHILSLSVADTNGLSYSGTLTISVGN